MIRRIDRSAPAVDAAYYSAARSRLARQLPFGLRRRDKRDR